MMEKNENLQVTRMVKSIREVVGEAAAQALLESIKNGDSRCCVCVEW